MTVIFRASAGLDVGNGHVMRCAALALRVRRLGHDVLIVTTQLPHSVSEWLESMCLDVVTLPTDDEVTDDLTISSMAHAFTPNDWLVVDHYQRDAAWEQRVNRGDARLCVIDDLADRPHACDLLIDVGMHALSGNPYRKLVPMNSEVLTGPSYALLRPEFDSWSPRERSGEVSRILVSLGGGEQVESEIMKILLGIWAAQHDGLEVRVLRDPGNSSTIDALANSLPSVTCLDFTEDMPGMLDWADVVIGTCGGASWERCLLGVPTLVCLTAENQRADYQALAEQGAVLVVGEATSTTPADWTLHLTSLLEDSSWTRALGNASRAIMKDRNGSLERLDGLFALRN